MKGDYYSRYRRRIASGSPASGRVVGAFDPMNQVVRYDAEVARLLSPEFSQLESGRMVSVQPDDPRAAAWAVVLHEHIHWWQYAGSSIGMQLMWATAAQAHAAQPDFALVAGEIGISKPLYRHVERQAQRLSAAGREAANRIVNNWMDIEMAYGLLDSPAAAGRIANDQYFSSPDHAYWIFLGNFRSVADATFCAEKLEKYESWNAEFSRLHSNWAAQSEHRVMLAPVGMHEVSEGHARFSELQYRASLDGKVGLSDFDRLGFLGPAYAAAFRFFLDFCGLSRPASVLAPEVLLFQAVCDFAMQSGEGYPCDIVTFDTFADDFHPGMRFVRACRALAPKIGAWLSAAAKATAESYWDIGYFLSRELLVASPLDVAKGVISFATQRGNAAACLHEAVSGRVDNPHPSLRYSYGRHLMLMSERLVNPDFFVWPGLQWSIRPGVDSRSDRTGILFSRHAAPFVHGTLKPELLNKGSIAFSTVLGVPEDLADMLLSTYFKWQIVYDVIRQLISADGPVDTSYKWIDPSKSSDYYLDAIEPELADAFGIRIRDVGIVR